VRPSAFAAYRAASTSLRIASADEAFHSALCNYPKLMATGGVPQRCAGLVANGTADFIGAGHGEPSVTIAQYDQKFLVSVTAYIVIRVH
jgi:hypothetical protein